MNVQTTKILQMVVGSGQHDRVMSILNSKLEPGNLQSFVQFFYQNEFVTSKAKESILPVILLEI